MRVWITALLLGLSTCMYEAPHAKAVYPGHSIVGPSIIPLSVHYLTENSAPRQNFRSWVERSNELIEPYGIAMVVWHEDRMFKMPNVVTTKQERDTLQSKVRHDGTLHVFVVDMVQTDPEHPLNGLLQNEGGQVFVILAKTARKSTLAHELAHALGIDHTEEKNNVMSTDRVEKETFFTDSQGAAMKAAARRFVMRDW